MSAITFHGVSKAFRGTSRRSIRDALSGSIRAIASPAPKDEIIHALRDVSFSVAHGESFALIGLNGAGKTTALKIISRITYPTAGKVTVQGRVGALIEVGTGMHPELTGRENIHLYGRILGLRSADIRGRFDDIVSFAGIGSALDRPIKQYSSGMQLRLGFSIAAHLDPDILVVDEALAVGDAGFQYQCVQKITSLVNAGRTLVFVSHDMTAIESVCSRAILLDAGAIVADGPCSQVLQEYLRRMQDQRLRLADLAMEGGSAAVSIEGATLHHVDGSPAALFAPGEGLVVRLHYRSSESNRRPIFSVGLSTARTGCFSLATMLVDGPLDEPLLDSGWVECIFPSLPLEPGTFEVWASLRGESGTGDLVSWQRLAIFTVDQVTAGVGVGWVTASNAAPVRIGHAWRLGRPR